MTVDAKESSGLSNMVTLDPSESQTKESGTKVLTNLTMVF